MAIMLMLLSYGATLCAFVSYSVKHRHGPHWRESLIGTHLCWAVAVLASTEILGTFHMLARGPVIAFWAITLVAAGAAALRISRGAAVPGLSRLSLAEYGLLAVLCGFAVILAITGILAPPNTWDAMTYHLPRVMHWIQNHSIQHYYTHIDRQLFHLPWSEFAVLHWYLLSGTDRTAALVQWSSYGMGAVAVSLIAADLGASCRGQIAAACLFASLPMAVLQGSSTQTDLNATLWLLCIIHLVLDPRERSPIAAGPGLGAAIGLALATKPTAGLFAAPFLLWYAWSSTRSSGRRVWRTWIIIAGIAVMFPIGHICRNLAWFGSPLSPAYFTDENVNATPGIPALATNALRNLACQINTPSPACNRAIVSGMTSLLRAAGLDINDPATTYPHTAVFSIRTLSADEDLTGNPLHLLLGAACLTLLLLRIKKMPDRNTAVYCAALAAGFAVFCIVLRWNPWNSRYLLPLAAAAAAWDAAILDRTVPQRALAVIAFIFLAAAVPWVFQNRLRPIVGNHSVFVADKEAIRFAKRPYLIAPYTLAADALAARQCSVIGLDLGCDDWEYPFWTMVRERGIVRPELFFVNLDSARTGRGADAPVEAIISIHAGRNDTLLYNRSRYVRTLDAAPLTLYFRQ